MKLVPMKRFFSLAICEGKIRKTKNMYSNVVQVKIIHSKIPFPLTRTTMIYATIYKAPETSSDLITFANAIVFLTTEYIEISNKSDKLNFRFMGTLTTYLKLTRAVRPHVNKSQI